MIGKGEGAALAVGVGVGLILLGGVAWLGYKASKTTAAGMGASLGGAFVDTIGGVVAGINNALPTAIRPTSDQNLVYRAANLPGQWISGDESWNLGGAIYDWTH